ncbi:hypothetical protein [Nocardioides pacificus]
MQMTRVAKLLTTAVLSGAVALSGAQLAGASALPASLTVAQTGAGPATTTVKTVSGADTSASERAKAPRAKRVARKQRTGKKIAERKRAIYREVLADPKMTDLEDLGPQIETAAKQGLARLNQLAKNLRKAKSPKRATAIVKRLRALQAKELHDVGRTAVAAFYAQEDPSAIRDVLEIIEGSPLAGPLAPVLGLIRGIVDMIDSTPLGKVLSIVDTLLGGLTGLLKNLISMLPIPTLPASAGR